LASALLAVLVSLLLDELDSLFALRLVCPEGDL
jgi:hypothetical protein